ncbi:hypothetical protein BGZ94_005695 [Podila epigama]|nr:hypothetical protein BGZ94_005695 [Podila epigama]
MRILRLHLHQFMFRRLLKSSNFERKLSVCTPFIPPSQTYKSVEDVVKEMPEYRYQLKFADPNSTASIEADIEGFFDMLAADSNLDDKERAYMIEQFKHSGFQGPLNYYRTRKINYEEELGLPRTIDIPSAIVVALGDRFIKPYQSEKMHHFVSSLKRVTIDGKHFVLYEKPNEINPILKELLEDLKTRRQTSSNL